MNNVSIPAGIPQNSAPEAHLRITDGINESGVKIVSLSGTYEFNGDSYQQVWLAMVTDVSGVIGHANFKGLDGKVSVQWSNTLIN